MSRSFSAGLVLPSAHHIVPRQPILAADVAALLDAVNWLHARGRLAFSQAWSDGIFARSSNAYSASGQVRYRVPDPGGGRTALTVYAYVTRAGASGAVKVTTFAGAATATTAIPGAGPAWVKVGPVTCSFGAGPEDVDVFTIGDGAGLTTVHTVFAEFEPASSPLGSGALGGFLALDGDEAAADAALSSDLLLTVQADLADLLARNRVLYTWSGLHDVDDGTAGPEEMPAWSHRVWGRATPGAIDRGRTLTVNAYCVNSGGSAADFVFNAGGQGVDGNEDFELRVSCAGGFSGWKSGTVELDEDSHAGPYDHPMAALTVYPAGSATAPARGWQRSDVDVRAISVWGR